MQGFHVLPCLVDAPHISPIRSYEPRNVMKFECSKHRWPLTIGWLINRGDAPKCRTNRQMVPNRPLYSSQKDITGLQGANPQVGHSGRNAKTFQVR